MTDPRQLGARLEAHRAGVGQCRDPTTVGLEDDDLWYNDNPDQGIPGLLDAIGVSEAYLVMKIWRAIWKVAGTLNRPAGGKYWDRDADPSLGIRRKTPKGRTAI
jgi:hypothetical protein